MAFEQLLNKEQTIILQCLTAILESNYIDDAEFQTRLGIDRKELQAVIRSWPNLNDTDQTSNIALAINNCMNEVCNGIAIPGHEWKNWFEASQKEVEGLYSKWVRLMGHSSRGIR